MRRLTRPGGRMRKSRMWLWILLLLPVLAYLFVVGFIYFAQTSLLFPARSVPLAGPLPDGWQRLTLDSPSGHRLHGIRVPSPASGADRPLILAFAGNAWNAESAASYLRDLYPQAEVIAFHYRGYSPSEGAPSAAALEADSLAVHDFARQISGQRRIVAVGFSIGSAVASHLAAHRPIDGAILVTPFDSLAEVASAHYPWLPVRFLFRHRMEPAEELGRSVVPVAIIAADRDRLIPPARTRALAEAVPNLVFDRTIAGASHNDIYDRPEFRRAMREAFERLSRER